MITIRKTYFIAIIAKKNNFGAGIIMAHKNMKELFFLNNAKEFFFCHPDLTKLYFMPITVNVVNFFDSNRLVYEMSKSALTDRELR